MALKLFNHILDKKSYYIAAESIGDCAKLMTAATRYSVSPYEVKTYFNQGGWGNVMDGIKPVRGVWVQSPAFSKEKPVKIL